MIVRLPSHVNYLQTLRSNAYNQGRDEGRVRRYKPVPNPAFDSVFLLKKATKLPIVQVGLRGFEPPTSASRTLKTSQVN